MFMVTLIMDEEIGLRERKKQRTRLLIAETAWRLFAEHGFDAVPVAVVARAAELSEATVFNYFPTKEDLVFQGMEAFETEMLAAVAGRPAGEPVVATFARFVLHPRGFLAASDDDAARQLAAFSRMITASPALLAREREVLARYTASLAAILAQDTGAEPDDPRPWVVARALIGTHQSLIEFVRRQVLAGPADHCGLAARVSAVGQQALALLEQGLAGYGARPATEPGSATEPGPAEPGPTEPGPADQLAVSSRPAGS
jgi:AcrR family transcriptional regulator